MSMCICCTFIIIPYLSLYTYTDLKALPPAAGPCMWTWDC